MKYLVTKETGIEIGVKKHKDDWSENELYNLHCNRRDMFPEKIGIYDTKTEAEIKANEIKKELSTAENIFSHGVKKVRFDLVEIEDVEVDEDGEIIDYGMECDAYIPV